MCICDTRTVLASWAPLHPPSLRSRSTSRVCRISGHGTCTPTPNQPSHPTIYSTKSKYWTPSNNAFKQQAGPAYKAEGGPSKARRLLVWHESQGHPFHCSSPPLQTYYFLVDYFFSEAQNPFRIFEPGVGFLAYGPTFAFFIPC
jgi:hypothetical protein